MKKSFFAAVGEVLATELKFWGNDSIDLFNVSGTYQMVPIKTEEQLRLEQEQRQRNGG
jgi:hypothetical protein